MTFRILFCTNTYYWVFQLARDREGRLVWDLLKNATWGNQKISELERRFDAVYRGRLDQNLLWREGDKRCYWYLNYEDYPL